MANLEDKFLNGSTPLTEKAGAKKKEETTRSLLEDQLGTTPLTEKAGGKKKGGTISTPIVQ